VCVPSLLIQSVQCAVLCCAVLCCTRGVAVNMRHSARYSIARLVLPRLCNAMHSCTALHYRKQ
jgi:hypothetical protein